MSKKISPAKKNKYQIELSSMSLVFWVVLIVFFMGWIFVLGVLVGRGFLPANSAIADLKAQVTKLQEMVARNKRADQKPQSKEDIDSKLGFYDKLESKKEDKKKPFPELPPEPPKSEKAVAKPADTTLAEVKADIAKKDSSVKKPEAAKSAGPEKKAKDAAPEPVKTADKASGPFRYVIQIAALDEKAKAEDMVRKLSGRGVEAYLQETVVKGKTFYRVRCGKFMTKEEANDYAQNLPREAGTNWRVVNVE